MMANLLEESVCEQYGACRINVAIGPRHGFVILPSIKPASPIPWVWYAPTLMGRYPNERHTWLCTRLLAAEVAVAGIDVGESYGNPEGRRGFTEFYQAVTRVYGLATKARLLAQSRGGLMHYNWAAEHPDLVDCIAGIYTVCDMASWPGLDQACTAYGLSAEQLAVQLPQHNPIDRLAPLAAARVPIFHIHGDNDAIVPLERNSGELARRYRALGGQMELCVVPGKGHEEIDEFFESERLLNVLCSGIPTRP